MNTKIIVDSGSDIPQNNLKGITVVPLTITFDEDEYYDGVTLDHKTFYEKLIESDTLPHTSQIPPSRFEDAISEALKDADDILVITMSSKLSGTYQSACIAAESFNGKVYVVDTLNVTVGERVLVDLAYNYIQEGHSAKETKEYVDSYVGKVHTIGLLDTLEYLKKGGRINAAAALAGNLLSLKPVICITDGEVKLLGTARGSKKGNNYLIEEIKRIGGVDFSKPFYLGYSGLTDTLLKKYIEDCGDLWRSETAVLPTMSVGATIGTHVGPNAIAVAFFEK